MSGGPVDHAALTIDAGAPRYPGIHPHVAIGGAPSAQPRWLMRATQLPPRAQLRDQFGKLAAREAI